MVGDTITVAGIGLRESATKDSLLAALAHADLDNRVQALVVLTQKAPILRRLAGADYEIIVLSAQMVRGVDTPTQSRRILEKYGTGSICEALALVAAGADALLDAPRHVSPDGAVTVALATGCGKI